jgi:hypothetical protein
MESYMFKSELFYKKMDPEVLRVIKAIQDRARKEPDSIKAKLLFQMMVPSNSNDYLQGFMYGLSIAWEFIKRESETGFDSEACDKFLEGLCVQAMAKYNL